MLLARVFHGDLWGSREDKHRVLAETDVATTPWQELAPQSSFYLFTPQDTDLLQEYQQGWKVTDIFPVNSVGIVTARDGLTIRWSAQDAWDTVRDFAALPEEEARSKYRLGEDVRDWKVALAQADLKQSGLRRELVVPVLYRLFDVRYTYYTGRSRGFICMPRPEVTRHMLAGENLGIITVRKVPPGGIPGYFMATRQAIVNGAIRSDNQSIDSLFPLYLYPDAKSPQGSLLAPGGRRPNLNPAFVAELEQRLGAQFRPLGAAEAPGPADAPTAHPGGEPCVATASERQTALANTAGQNATFTPEDVFHYIYAVLHSPTYRTRYAEFLKIDFPRVPLTSDLALFRTLAALGAELVALHLLDSPVLANFITRYPVSGSDRVERVRYNAAAQRVIINADQYFEGVPPEVWEFHVGGYQVCEKWLKDRQGRILSYDDLTHYQRIVGALKETIRLMVGMDRLIPTWPLA